MIRVLFIALLLAGRLNSAKIDEWRFEVTPLSTHLGNSVCGNASISEAGTPSYPTSPTPIYDGSYITGKFTDANYFTLAAGSLSNFSNLSAYTVEGYVYFDSFGTVAAPVVLYWNDGFGDSYFQVNNTLNIIRWVTRLGHGTQNVLDYTFDPVEDTWYYFALTYDGTNKKTIWSLASTIDSSADATGAATAGTGTITVFTLGRYSSANFYTDGYFDRLAISNSAESSFPTSDPAACGATSVQTRGLKLRKTLRLNQ